MGRKTRPETLFEWALFYASLGLPVLPLVPRGKRPATGSGGVYNATTDPDQIRRWWAQNPEYNIGIRTGEASGLVVIDFDKAPPDGFSRPITPQARSGGRNGQGSHLYFGATTALKSFAFSHGEFLAEKRYVVAPPSIHPSGEPYAWIDFLGLGDCELAELTDATLERLGGMRIARENGERGDQERGRARKNIGDTLSCSLPRSSHNWPYREHAQDEQLAMEIVRHCGGSPRPIGKSFQCPIHEDKQPSVALWKPENDPDGIICLHHLHQPGPEWIPPCDLYAHCKFRRPIPLNGPERPVWWIRLLHSLHRIGLPEIPAPPLPPSAPTAALKLYEGFVLLLRCREAFEAGQHLAGAPFSWRFAGDWSGIRSVSAVREGLIYLIDGGFLQKEVRSLSKGKLTFYRLSAVGMTIYRAPSIPQVAGPQSLPQSPSPTTPLLPEGEDYDADMAAWRAARGRPTFHPMNVFAYEGDAAWHAMSIADRSKLVRAAGGGGV